MILNPIIQRELIGQLRMKKALVIQACLLGILSLLVMLRWPTDARVDTTGAQSQQVLQLFGYGMMTALVLLVPAFPATSIVREKIKGTLALLVNAAMGRWTIFFGKLVGTMGFSLLLLVLSFPAAAACYAMGGVGAGQIARIYGVLAMLCLLMATLGLMVSSFSMRPESAMRFTYGLVLFIVVFTLGPDQFRGSKARGAEAAVIAVIKSASPLPAMTEVLGQGSFTNKGMKGTEREPVRFMFISLILSVIFAAITAWRLDSRLFDRARAAGKITDERSQGVRLFRRIMYLWFFDPQRRAGMIGPLTNPVMVKEFRCRRFGRSHWIMRIFAFCLIVSMGLTLCTTSGTIQWGVGQLGRVILMMQFALIVLLTPSLTSGLIAGERESGGWQLLQMTPMSTVQIVTGKLLSALFTLMLVLVATVPCYFVMVRIDTNTLWIKECTYTLLLSTAMALLLTAAISSLVRTTAAATTTSYTVMILLFAGTMLVWMGRDGAPFSHGTVEAALMFNPFAATLASVRSEGFAQYDLLPWNWYIMGSVCVGSLMVLVIQTWRLTRPS